MICFKCKQETLVEGTPGRQQLCAQCKSYLHCCRNCRFYDELAWHGCREPQAEWVKEKELGNFCGYFSAGTRASEEQDRAAAARRRLDELFGKKE